MNLHNNLLFLDALAVLKEIQKRSPEAIIAGGFLRDLYMGKQPKDLDIFVSEIKNYGYDFIVTKDYDMSYGSDSEIGSVQNLYQIGAPVHLDINVIEVKDIKPIERVNSHDFNFCQCAFDGENFHNLDELEETAEFGYVVLGLCETFKQFVRSIKRWVRFKEKYPELELFTHSDNLTYLPQLKEEEPELYSKVYNAFNIHSR